MAASKNSLEQSINLTPPQAQAVQAALQQWQNTNLISSKLVSELLATIQVEEQSFDWERFAKYTFRLAIICLAIAVVSILADDAVLKLIKRVLELPAWLRSALTGLAAVGVHVWGYQRSIELPLQVWTNEAVHSLGALLFGLAALQLLGSIDDIDKKQDEKLNWILLCLAGIYGVTGVMTMSNFIWSCGMIVLGTWFGAVTGYISGFGAYFLGMSYPFRFVFFGLGIIGAAYLMPLSKHTAALWSSTRIWGMLYLFIALWILSVFGNDELSSDDKRSYRRSSNTRLFVWSLAFFVAAAFSVWHGLRYGDSTTKGFGLAFLGINLYTKFFECFWDRWYKPLFFAVVAATLAIVGRYAENLWNLQVGR